MSKQHQQPVHQPHERARQCEQRTDDDYTDSWTVTVDEAADERE